MEIEVAELDLSTERPARVHQKGECTIEGCRRALRSRGMCRSHYLRLLRYGDPLRYPPRGTRKKSETPSYNTAHTRVLRKKGRARDQVCIWCGQPAQQWAYQHRGGVVLRTEAGILYSPDPDDYEPMCGLCHRKLDIDMKWKAHMIDLGLDSINC